MNAADEAELRCLHEAGEQIDFAGLLRLRERARLVVEALNAGVPVEEVRAKFLPELHEEILSGRRQAQLNTRQRRLARTTTRVVWGYVYVFAAGPFVKVGMSDVGVTSRWHNIRCGNPLLEPPLYVSSPLGDRALQAERRVHELLSPYREGGEWFRCERSLAIDTVKAVEKEFS